MFASTMGEKNKKFWTKLPFKQTPMPTKRVAFFWRFFRPLPGFSPPAARVSPSAAWGPVAVPRRRKNPAAALTACIAQWFFHWLVIEAPAVQFPVPAFWGWDCRPNSFLGANRRAHSPAQMLYNTPARSAEEICLGHSGWMDGWMDDELTDGRWLDGWLSGLRDGWMNG